MSCLRGQVRAAQGALSKQRDIAHIGHLSECPMCTMSSCLLKHRAKASAMAVWSTTVTKPSQYCPICALSDLFAFYRRCLTVDSHHMMKRATMLRRDGGQEKRDYVTLTATSCCLLLRENSHSTTDTHSHAQWQAAAHTAAASVCTETHGLTTTLLLL